MADEPERSEYIQVRVTKPFKKRVRSAAGAEDKSLSEWVRETLDEAARRQSDTNDSADEETEAAVPDGGGA